VQSYRLLAQLPPPQPQAVQLGPLLERVVLLEQRLPVIFDPGPPASLDADPDQLEQMFINLLANAVDASLANGSHPVRASWRVAEGNLLVTIEDRGMGIANTENLFVPSTPPSLPAAAWAWPWPSRSPAPTAAKSALVNREDGEGARATIRLPLPD
jgi:two-component system nitrogen regulation sensor histidine kinase NtrY